jgi:NADPH-dependent glutamate synthase beta subunit-like oxidoreductase
LRTYGPSFNRRELGLTIRRLDQARRYFPHSPVFSVSGALLMDDVVVRLYGKRESPQAYAIRDYLQRSDVPFKWVELKENEQARATPNIEVLPNTEVAGLHGDERLYAVTLRNRKTGEERIVEATSLFLCLGGVPNTQWAAEVGIVRDEEGYLVTGPDLGRGGTLPANWTLNREPYYLETSMPGVFAAGDVRHSSIKRLASAVGEGAMVVAFVHRYLAAG